MEGREGWLLEGVIVDSRGAEPGYLRLDPAGRIVERGATGTQGPLGSGERRVRGIILPRAVNGHTHLADGLWTREPPRQSVQELVSPPNGLKHLLLARSSRRKKVGGMRRALWEMARSGVGAVLDFREEGVEGVRMLREAAQGLPLQVVALGRPAQLPPAAEELRPLLDLGDGLGLSAVADLGLSTARELAEACHRRGRKLAVHVSESEREELDPVLALAPDLLVHLSRTTEEDQQRIAQAKLTVAGCPRSNALFGRAPPLASWERLGVPFLLGTDNRMLASTDLFSEMEFAYLSARSRGETLSPKALVESVFLEGWRWLGRSQQAALDPGTSGLLVLRRPLDDPYYQVCCRGHEGKLFVPPVPAEPSGT